MAADPLYRCRATSIVLTWLTEPWAGLQPLWYNLTSLLVHVMNAWLVFSLGVWRRIGWRVSSAAACFFAIYEGHQEAVVWYAALPELLVVFFVLACVLLWILRYEFPRRARLCYGASLAVFLLALASKESGVAAVGLLALVALREKEEWRRCAKLLAPFAFLALLYFVADFAGGSQNQHYSDGTFSLFAPFWTTLPRSFARMIWVWGLVSLVALSIWRARSRVPLVATAVCWMVVSLFPYSFLTYMPVVPSRHTYLAGVGLSLVVAAGFVALREQPGSRRSIVAAVVLLIFAHNTSYLWIRKQRQFIERAEPTELLVENLRDRQGPVEVYCFPYPPNAADLVVSMRLGSQVQPRVAVMGRPAVPLDGAVDLCGTALARAAMR
ncbi:MAG: hypothetical protein NTW28_31075 [Candidatus Solibacter sp.]|nr:hypothetical protein [Candidatus Solibacter sp.]